MIGAGRGVYGGGMGEGGCGQTTGVGILVSKPLNPYYNEVLVAL